MSRKSKQQFREYHKGYEDGRHGKKYDDGWSPGLALASLGLAGRPRPEAESYREGYTHGRKDRRR